VRTQVWIAISVYVVVAILKKELKIEASMNEILQILSIALFEKTSIFTVFSRAGEPTRIPESHNPLPLFDF